MSSNLKRTLFTLFIISGFCGLLYQIVWMRMAMASFGVIAPIISVVVSVFMLGLSVGSWAGGKWIKPFSDRFHISPIVSYGIIELIIGASALCVPFLFEIGRSLLLPLGSMNSFQYLFFSAGIIAIVMLPWCTCMGATFPFMMEFLRRTNRTETTSFSYLYLANVIGAMFGTIMTSVVIIELLGFKQSLIIAGCLNIFIALVSFVLGKSYSYQKLSLQVNSEAPSSESVTFSDSALKKTWICTILFFTGFASMALEIVWIRAFAPVLGTLVYSFAGLLAVYLLATWVGSYYYRWSARMNRQLSIHALIIFLSVFVLLPSIIGDPRIENIIVRFERILNIDISAVPFVLASIFPFCAGLGYLTPMLIDRYSNGNPDHAGRSYAINIIGSILGPLAGGYFFLPLFGAKTSMVLLALPFIGVFAAYIFYRPEIFKKTATIIATLVIALSVIVSLFVSHSYEDGGYIRNYKEIRRDHSATVISTGSGMRKRLIVNGQTMVTLTPITKMMAHLPMAFLEEKPESGLIIAFGMGTTFRSLLTWDVKVTAVDLIPSVVEAFGYYHSNADEVLSDPDGKIIIDDGRRFLARTDQKFDVIIVDPPPPIETAGSSMLYSEEFYSLMKKRLKPEGIAQLWVPWFEFDSDMKILEAVMRSIQNSFEHVLMFKSLEGWGYHMLASMSPIKIPSAEVFMSRMPEAAKLDMMEWPLPDNELSDLILNHVLNNELNIKEFLSDDTEIRITDDLPLNEYFYLRRLKM